MRETSVLYPEQMEREPQSRLEVQSLVEETRLLSLPSWMRPHRYGMEGEGKLLTPATQKRNTAKDLRRSVRQTLNVVLAIVSKGKMGFVAAHCVPKTAQRDTNVKRSLIPIQMWLASVFPLWTPCAKSA